MTDIRTIDDRVRENARQLFSRQVDGAIKAVESLISNTSAVKGVSHRDKDITDKKLLEVVKDHIIATQSMQQEENAVAEFMAEFERLKMTDHPPQSKIGSVLSEE